MTFPDNAESYFHISAASSSGFARTAICALDFISKETTCSDNSSANVI